MSASFSDILKQVSECSTKVVAVAAAQTLLLVMIDPNGHVLIVEVETLLHDVACFSF